MADAGPAEAEQASSKQPKDESASDQQPIDTAAPAQKATGKRRRGKAETEETAKGM